VRGIEQLHIGKAVGEKCVEGSAQGGAIGEVTAACDEQVKAQAHSTNNSLNRWLTFVVTER
jgi:hypothetical protein